MSKDYFTRGNFFKSKTWNDCKAAYLEEVRDLCEVCMSEGQYILAVDVILKVSPRKLNLDDPDLTIDPENLVAVCYKHRGRLYRQRKQEKAAGLRSCTPYHTNRARREPPGRRRTDEQGD